MEIEVKIDFMQKVDKTCHNSTQTDKPDLAYHGNHMDQFIDHAYSCTRFGRVYAVYLGFKQSFKVSLKIKF